MRTKIIVSGELRKANDANLAARQKLQELRSAATKDEAKIQEAMDDLFAKATKLDQLRSELVEIEDQEMTDALLAKGANEEAHEDKNGIRRKAEYRAAFNAYLRSASISDLSPEHRKLLNEMRAMNTGSNTEGGFVVDKETMTTVSEEKHTWGAIYALTQKLVTQRGNSIDWPVSEEGLTRGVIVGENENHGKSNSGFSQETMGAHKISSRIILVSEELIQDAFIDIANYVTAIARKRVDLGINYYIVHGAGGDREPKGVLLQLKSSKKIATSGTTPAAIFDSIIDVIHGVDAAYRAMPNFRVAINDKTLATIRKWKDDQGNPIYIRDPRADWPDTLFGEKLIIDNELPDIGTDGWVVAGDFSSLIVRLAGDMVVRRLNELYAETGQVGFLAWQRFGVVLMDKAAMAAGFTAANAGTPDKWGTTEAQDIGGTVFNPTVSNAPNDTAAHQQAAAGGGAGTQTTASETGSGFE